MREKESDRYNNRVMRARVGLLPSSSGGVQYSQASDVARSVRFRVSTSGLMGLFVNSHATGRGGDDDWAQGSGGDSVEGGGV